jgi:hypothetical protein
MILKLRMLIWLGTWNYRASGALRRRDGAVFSNFSGRDVLIAEWRKLRFSKKDHQKWDCPKRHPPGAKPERDRPETSTLEQGGNESGRLSPSLRLSAFRCASLDRHLLVDWCCFICPMPARSWFTNRATATPPVQGYTVSVSSLIGVCRGVVFGSRRRLLHRQVL